MIETLLAPGLGTGVSAALIAASFATSFFSAAFGIGGGTVLLAILASLLPPSVLIPIHGLVQLGANFSRAAIMLPHVLWSVLPPFLAGSAIGAALGGVLVVNISPRVIQIGVGLFILWSVLARPPYWMRRFAWATGGVSSFLTMFFGATGPFVAAFVKSLGLDRSGHISTHAVMMTAQHSLKTVVFGILGFAYGPWLPFVIAMIAATFAGSFAGRFALARIDEKVFGMVLNAVLLALAARLVWSGLVG